MNYVTVHVHCTCICKTLAEHKDVLCEEPLPPYRLGYILKYHHYKSDLFPLYLYFVAMMTLGIF